MGTNTFYEAAGWVGDIWGSRCAWPFETEGGGGGGAQRAGLLIYLLLIVLLLMMMDDFCLYVAVLFIIIMFIMFYVLGHQGVFLARLGWLACCSVGRLVGSRFVSFFFFYFDGVFVLVFSVCLCFVSLIFVVVVFGNDCLIIHCLKKNALRGITAQ